MAEGASVNVIENDLARRGLQVKKIREKKGLQVEISPERVPRQEVMHFSRQVAAFVRTGIPILDAVRVVEQGTGNKRFQAILADVREQLQAGVPFSEALAPHSAVFPTYYLGILRSAELTGQLDVVLDQLAIYIERDVEARSKVKSALTYPLVVMAMSVVTMIVMVAFVLPKFVDLLRGPPLPAARCPPACCSGFSDFTQSYWWAILLVVVLLVGGFILSGRTEGGLEARHRAFLSMPLVGDHRPVLGGRAVLPDHLRHDAGRRAAARGHGLGHRIHQQQGLRERAQDAPATRCSRATASPARWPAPSCSPSPRCR